MEKTLNPVNLQRLHENLQSLGYRRIKIDGRRSEWRRSTFHLHTYPFGKKGVKLKLHKDIWEKPPPTPKHKTKYKGKDIWQELQRIQQKYRQTTQKR